MKSRDSVDAVAAFCGATERNDIDAIVATLAPSAELVSPVSGRMIFRGRQDLGVFLSAVYSSLSDVHWRQTLTAGDVRVVLGEAAIGPVRITDAMVVELDEDGLIRRITPHLRPWLGLTLVAITLGTKVARRPGVIRRALRKQ
jgi:limonene-1,2-epoxide hydrolase